MSTQPQHAHDETARSHEHLSDLALDALAVGLTPDEATERRAHHAMVTCTECHARADVLAAARTSYAAHPRSRRLEALLVQRLRDREAAGGRPVWWSWRALFGTAGVAAAAVSLVLWVTPTGALAPETGLKGVTALEAFVQRDGRVARVRGADVVRAGDAIGFRVTTATDVHIALFGTADGLPVALLPADGGAPPRHLGRKAVDLPVSAVLDAEGERERFALVACPEPFRTAAAASVLGSWSSDDRAGLPSVKARVRAALGKSCDVRLLTLGKRP